jgi:hypothetical protein
MLKNESARNATKPMPLRPYRLLDSGGIFTLSNGLRMEKISHSVRKVKQAKKKIADCAVRTVCTDVDVACSYSDTWQVHTGDMWKLQGVTRGRKIRVYGGTVGRIRR